MRRSIPSARGLASAPITFEPYNNESRHGGRGAELRQRLGELFRQHLYRPAIVGFGRGKQSGLRRWENDRRSALSQYRDQPLFAGLDHGFESQREPVLQRLIDGHTL